ncbi:MAG: Ig-like domain-containing protein [Candidatus Saccharibacteria bacterium]|nr:Ig-like domain-containing protein [Candidatus Saccharibacteria bacterium]
MVDQSAPDPEPVDSEPPTVSFLEPAEGATLSDTVTVEAEAEDNEGIDYVEYFINQSKFDQEGGDPYDTTLDTTQFANGEYTIMARAVDINGNSSTDSVNIAY